MMKSDVICSIVHNNLLSFFRIVTPGQAGGASQNEADGGNKDLNWVRCRRDWDQDGSGWHKQQLHYATSGQTVFQLSCIELIEVKSVARDGHRL
jgi:hypothetical protein